MNILIIYENSKKEMDYDTKSIYETLHNINKYEQINISEITLNNDGISYFHYLKYLKKREAYFNAFNRNYYEDTPFDLKNIISIINNIRACNLIIVVTSSDTANHVNIKKLFETLSYIFLPHKKLNKEINDVVAVIVSSNNNSSSRALCRYLSNSLLLMGVKDLLTFNLKNQHIPQTEWNKIKLQLIAERLIFCIHNKADTSFIHKYINNYAFFKFNSFKYTLSKLKNISYLIN